MTRRSREHETVRVTIRGGMAVPYSRADAEALAAYEGKVVDMHLHQERTPGQMRLYRRLLKIVADNSEAFLFADDLHTMLCTRCGLADVTFLNTDPIKMMVEPRSSGALDAVEFTAFFNRAMYILATEVIPGLDIDVLIREHRYLVED